jgi:hypothetical protein
LTLLGELANDPRAGRFAAKRLSREGLRSLDRIAHLGLNLSELGWRTSHLEPA